MVEPIGGRARGELAFGRAIELPHLLEAERVDGGVFQRRGARGAGVDREAEAAERRQFVEGEEPLQVRWHHECGRGSMQRDRAGRGVRVERAQDHHGASRQQRAAAEADGDRVVERRTHEVSVGGVELPEVGLLADQRGGLGVVEHPRPHALGLPGRSGRVVHRPGQGVGRDVGRLARGEARELGVVDHAGRPGVVEQRHALVVEQARVEEHGHDPDPQGAKDPRQHQSGRGRL